MREILVDRALKPAQAKEWVNRRAEHVNPSDVGELPVLFRDAFTGEPVACLAKADQRDIETLTSAIQSFRTHFGGVVRAGGMRSKSATFGYSGPSPVIQRVAPSAASWAWTHPESHNAVAGYSAKLAALFKDIGPAGPVATNETARSDINPDWRMGNTCWTSGIVNDTAGLYYHYDKNNVPDTWSAMIVLRAGTKGGHLHIADYDITVPCRNGDLLFFPGMNYAHGVTPITESLKGGYRFSAVYYSVKRFAGMAGSSESLETAQVRRVHLEENLLARQKDQGLIK